jgi:hypothetical protein
LKDFRGKSCVFVTPFSLKIDRGVKLLARAFSFKNGFLIKPVFNFLSLDLRTNELNNSSFFFKNAKSVVFWNVEQYSS